MMLRWSLMLVLMPSMTVSRRALHMRAMAHCAVLAVGDQLADHGVVVGRDRIAAVDVGLHADAGTAGGVELGDLAGARA